MYLDVRPALEGWEGVRMRVSRQLEEVKKDVSERFASFTDTSKHTHTHTRGRKGREGGHQRERRRSEGHRNTHITHTHTLKKGRWQAGRKVRIERETIFNMYRTQYF
jgi:hypothetical protein